MARIRTIKPSFFTSLTIADLTIEQRLTFIGLWTHSDDTGRSIYDPRLIRAALWPLDDRTAESVADDVRALTAHSLLTHYIVNERAYLVINTWAEHQRINRPVKSILPAPSDGQIVPLTCGNEPTVRTQCVNSEDTVREGKGMEGNGRGKGVLPRPAQTDEFDAFWAAYPKRTDKGHARTAWAKAVRKADATEITAAAQRFADDPNLNPDANFIPLAATWLNGERWADGPQAARTTNSRPTTDDKVRGGLDLAARLRSEESATHQIGA